jgi:hypothetical protein
MARRCKYSKCRAELPAARQCTDYTQKKGFCSIECMASCGMERAEIAASKKKTKELREYREKSKTLAQHVAGAQVHVNRLVVAEDRSKGCISCPSPEVSDAGHYFHKGMKYRTSPLTLDRRNLAGQCMNCNRFKGGGNQHEYRLGYIARYGQAAFDNLCEYKASVDRGEVPSLSVDESKAIAASARKRLKEINSL